MMDKKVSPRVSFITPMKEQDFRVIALLESIRRQNYPQDKIEIIIVDGGSNPEVIKACKKYKPLILFNPKMLAEGAGMGKDQGIWAAKGEFIVIAESDIELMGKDWINRMLRPLLMDKDLFASAPRTYVHPNDNSANQYLSYVGVDPFAAYRSLEGLLELSVIKKEHQKGYDVIMLDPKRPLCMGSNGFMFRKHLINKVGDYAQDVEFIARLVKKGYLKFAVIENAPVWHKNVKNLKDFLKKRLKWTAKYSTTYIKEKKDFVWITNRPRFLAYVLMNLLIVPNIFVALWKMIITRNPVWALHPFMMLISTSINIYYALQSPHMLGQVTGRKLD